MDSSSKTSYTRTPPVVIPFDVNNLRITNVKKNRYNGRSQAYINSVSTRGRIAFKAPKMRAPFDTKVQVFDDGHPKCQIALSFDNIDPASADYDAGMAAFHANLLAIEELIIQRAANDPQNWLGQSLVDKTPEKRLQTARRQFTSLVRKGAMNERTGKPYADMVRVKLYLQQGTGYPEIPVKLKKGNEARTDVAPKDVINLLTPNARVKWAFSFSTIWFKRSGRLNTFGLSIVAQALEIFPYERITKVIPTNDFNANDLVFSDDQRNAYGSPTCHIGYGDIKTRVTLTSPWADVMGSKEGEFHEFYPDTPAKRYMRLRFVDVDNVDTINFLKIITGIQNALKQTAVERSKAWFGETITNEDINDFFTPCKRQIGDTKGDVVDPREPYYIKFKLPLPRGAEVTAEGPPPTNWRTTFKDRNGEPIDGEAIHDIMRRGSRARVTFQTSPVYVMSSSTFGIPLEAVEVVVDVDVTQLDAVDNTGEFTSNTGTSKGHSLFDDDPDDLAAVAAQLTSASSTAMEDHNTVPANSPVLATT